MLVGPLAPNLSDALWNRRTHKCNGRKRTQAKRARSCVVCGSVEKSVWACTGPIGRHQQPNLCSDRYQEISILFFFLLYFAAMPMCSCMYWMHACMHVCMYVDVCMRVWSPLYFVSYSAFKHLVEFLTEPPYYISLTFSYIAHIFGKKEETKRNSPMSVSYTIFNKFCASIMFPWIVQQIVRRCDFNVGSRHFIVIYSSFSFILCECAFVFLRSYLVAFMRRPCLSRSFHLSQR